jgi:hypothetical protein
MFAPVATTTIATSVVSSAAQDALADGAALGWVTFSVLGADAWLIFGSSAVAAATAGAGGNAFPLSAGSREPYYLNSATKYFRVITASGSGTISFSRSGP